MCAIAPEMGSCWEKNISRLLEQANDTLASSARSRHHSHSQKVTHSESGSGRWDARTSPPYRGRSFPLRSGLSNFRGDRSASYRRGSDAWDSSLLESRPDGFDGFGLDSPPSHRPAPLSASFSRRAGARVDEARLDGMEDRVRLEVQAVVRRDVDQRVSVTERVTRSVESRVVGLADEVSALEERVSKVSAGHQTQRVMLEEMQADDQRSRCAVSALASWRADREGWCTTTDSFLATLEERTRSLARRADFHQKALDEVVETQEGMAASLQAARKAGEGAAATALAPVREHFLAEIATIRKRLMTIEDGTKLSGVAETTKAHIQSMTDIGADAKGEEVWRKVEAQVREKIAGMVREAVAEAIADREGMDHHLTEVGERLAAGDSSLMAAAPAGDKSPKGSETRGITLSKPEQPTDGLARFDETWERRIFDGLHGVEEQLAKHVSESGDKSLDLDRRVELLEELERLRPKASLVDASVGAESATPAAVADIETMASTMGELVTGAAATVTRQGATEDKLEELSEKLCGHSLKLRCLEGLWRDTANADHPRNIAEEGPDGIHGVGERGTRRSDTAEVPDAATKTGIVRSRRNQRGEERGRNQHEPQPHVANTAGELHAPLISSTAPIRSGLTGFLQRLGSSSSSSFSQSKGIVRAGSTVATVNHKAKKSSDSGQGEHAIQIEAMESQLETSPTGASVPHSCSVSDGQALRDGNTYDVGREAGGDTTSDAQALKRQDAHTKAGRDPTSCVGERSSDSVRTGSNSVKGDDNLQNQSGTDRHSNGKEGYTEREHDGSVNGRRVARTPSDEETRTVVGGQESGGDTGAVNGVLNGESVSCQHDNSETPIEVIVAHDTSASPAADEDDKHVDKIREEENVMPQGQITSGVGGSIDVPTSTIEMPNAQHAKNLELKPCTGSAFGAKEVDGKANSVRTKTNFDRAEAGAIPSTPTKAAVAVSEQKRSDEGSRHVAGIKANAVAVAVARVAAAAAAAPGRQQVPEPDLDETGSSIDCSMHSRWSLPGGGGTGGLHEQGSVWGRGDDGLDQEDDSVGSAEQAPSSEREMEGSDDGKNVRSRVESYDLQHRPEDAYMDPFSPDRPTATSDGDTSSVQNVVGVSESSLVVSLQSNSDVAIKAVNTSEEVQDVSAAGDNVERSDVALFGSVGLPGEATSSTLPGSGGSNGGGDDDGEAQDTIAMQKFVSLDIDEGIVKIEDSPIARERTGTGHESSEAYSDDKGGGEGLRSGGDNSDANTGSHVSAGSAKYAGSPDPRHDVLFSETDNDRADVGLEESTPKRVGQGGEGDGGGVLSACLTPAPGAWAPPDFGFSSDEDDALHGQSCAASDSSSSRVFEGGERLSSPTQGNSDGFDSGSAAS